MIDLPATAFLWTKAMHIASMVAWMAGMFYLPRLYVYHCDAKPGSPASETFKVMERRLLRAIVNPAMIATFLTGGVLLANLPISTWETGWIWVKLAAVLGMATVHGALARWRRDFEKDANRRSARFYRIANEVPTILLLVIVAMAVVRPF